VPDEQLADIAAAATEAGVDGVVVSNTTVSRPEHLAGAAKGEAGGLSGRPLFDISTRVLRDMRRALPAGIDLVGVGGVASAADAYAKIRAGAVAVQVYTALVYQGTALVDAVLDELPDMLRSDGFADVRSAAGSGL